MIQPCRALRSAYLDVKRALPWLDACAREEDPPAFPEHARPPGTPGVKAWTLRAGEAPPEDARLCRYVSDLSGPLDGLAPVLDRLAERGAAVSFPHTEVPFEDLRRLAERFPRLSLIIESGPRKLLYHYEDVVATLHARRNVHLCTYNFCNWLGHEQLRAMGLGDRLLFGSHGPRFSEDAAMGPVAMGRMTWNRKCDIAGNNLRRLLGMAVVEPPEVAFDPPEPFIVDAHAHNVRPSETTPNPFPSPDQRFTPEDWLREMDACALERVQLIAMEAIYDASLTSRDLTADLRRAAPDRFAWFEVYHPDGDAEHRRRLAESLGDAGCVGVKIHPTAHEVAADDERYAHVFRLASERRKPILTHSWEVSSYNPHQRLSHPDRFRRWLAAFPDVRLILGHAGGRPGAFDATLALCRDFPRVSVDLAGDYYDNGVVEALVAALGAERVIFGSDVDWLDPRCNLAPVLASRLSNEEVFSVLRRNAERVFDAV